MLEGVDVSWVQGAYQPAGEDFVIVNASRANVGLVVGSEYRVQVANARAAGKHVGHYFFNGNFDPVVCANFFVDNLDYRAGESLWLDVESESSTGTVAWTPSQTLAFLNQVHARLGVVPGVYLNKSLMDGFDWSAVVATGAPLWIAYYNPSPPPIKWWPTWTVWQYTSTPIDRNQAQGSLTTASTGAPVQIPVEDDMPKYQIVNAAGSQSLIFTGPGIAFPIPNMTWEAVLSKWADATNSNAVPDLTDGQWAIVTAAFASESAQIDYEKIETGIAQQVIAALPKTGTTLTEQDIVNALKTLTLKAA